jgi:DNA uptake protein ComE-like DNA-binding protein
MYSQFRGVIAFVSILILILAVRLAFNPKTIDDRQPASGSNAAQLDDRIDPNLATAPELAAIPDLGEKRAESIVAFRDRFKARHPNKPPFERLTDLEQIPGIGAATAENMQPYLKFPISAK